MARRPERGVAHVWGPLVVGWRPWPTGPGSAAAGQPSTSPTTRITPTISFSPSSKVSRTTAHPELGGFRLLHAAPIHAPFMTLNKQGHHLLDPASSLPAGTRSTLLGTNNHATSHLKPCSTLPSTFIPAPWIQGHSSIGSFALRPRAPPDVGNQHMPCRGYPATPLAPPGAGWPQGWYPPLLRRVFPSLWKRRTRQGQAPTSPYLPLTHSTVSAYLIYIVLPRQPTHSPMASPQNLMRINSHLIDPGGSTYPRDSPSPHDRSVSHALPVSGRGSNHHPFLQLWRKLICGGAATPPLQGRLGQ